MKRWLVRVFVVFLVLLAVLFVAGWIASEPRPEGVPGPDAEALARKIEATVDKEAWEGIGAVWWGFGDRNVHLWDKRRNLARVRWKDVEVLVDLGTKKGIATKAGARVDGEEAEQLIDDAYRRWVNDSFWLNPLVKLFDEGTSRAIVKQEDGSDALLITYGAGGVTPGDAYLWIIGDDGLPKAWKMWVDILPIGGIEVSWERWIALPNGAKVATLHEGLFKLEMKDVQGAPSVASIEAEDPFAALVTQPATQPAK